MGATFVPKHSGLFYLQIEFLVNVSYCSPELILVLQELSNNKYKKCQSAYNPD